MKQHRIELFFRSTIIFQTSKIKNGAQQFPNYPAKHQNLRPLLITQNQLPVRKYLNTKNISAKLTQLIQNNISIRCV